MSRPSADRSLVAIAILAWFCTGTSISQAQFRPPGRYDAPADTSRVRLAAYQPVAPSAIHTSQHPMSSADLGYADPNLAEPTFAGDHRPEYDLPPYDAVDPRHQTSQPLVHGSWPTHPARRALPTDSPYQPVYATGHQSPDTLELPEPLPHEQPAGPGAPVRQRVWQPRQGLEGEESCDTQPPWLVPFKSSFRTTVLPGSGDDLGLTNLNARLVLGSLRVPGFMITPGAIVTFLDGPLRTDLPSELYSTWVEFMYMKKFNDRWSMQLAISPGLYTDFRNVDGDSVRIIGRALAFWQYTPATQIAFGVVYLDRENIAALPAVGMIYQPREDLRLEVIFPRPRALYRVMQRGDAEGWAYLAGEFGGGSWAIERANGTDDVVTYGDLRMLAGFEWRPRERRKIFVEGGWVFERDVEYDSGIGDFSPNQTGLIRAGIDY